MLEQKYKMTNEEAVALLQSPSGDEWAKAFCKMYPEVDLDTMRGWFCSAMMAMYDAVHQGRVK